MPETPADALDPRRFEDAIRNFEQRDRLQPPVKNPTLFVGSSSFTRWTSLEEEFRQFNALNRGFGGSMFPDLLHFYPRVVRPYHPRKIVVYEGTNDIAHGRSAPQVLADFRAFCRLVENDFPHADIYALSLVPGPERVALAARMDEANALLRDFIRQHPRRHYMDARHLLTDSGGHADPRFYADPIHPNDAGYARWRPVITAALEVPPDAARSDDLPCWRKRFATLRATPAARA